MMKSCLVTIYNTVVNFLAHTLIIWALITNLSLGTRGIGVFLMAVVIFCVLYFVGVCELRRKSSAEFMSYQFAKNVSIVTFLIAITIAVCQWFELTTVIITHQIWDTVLQSIPYGIGNLFTVMAYQSVNMLDGVRESAEFYQSNVVWNIIEILLVFVSSVFDSMRWAFKLKEDNDDCYVNKN